MKLKNPVLLLLCSVHGTDVKSGNIPLPDLVKLGDVSGRKKKLRPSNWRVSSSVELVAGRRVLLIVMRLSCGRHRGRCVNRSRLWSQRPSAAGPDRSSLARRPHSLRFGRCQSSLRWPPSLMARVESFILGAATTLPRNKWMFPFLDSKCCRFSFEILLGDLPLIYSTRPSYDVYWQIASCWFLLTSSVFVTLMLHYLLHFGDFWPDEFLIDFRLLFPLSLAPSVPFMFKWWRDSLNDFDQTKYF
jgi:hypothetical protein